MSDIVDCCAYVIDLSNAMLEHRKGLNAQQIDHLETINRRAVDFVTSFLLHEKADLDELFSYLNHDAMQPVVVVVGYTEFMLMGGAGGLLPAYREAIEEIRDCGYFLRNAVQDMTEDLIGFMESIGYERKTRTQQTELMQTVQPKAIQPLQAPQGKNSATGQAAPTPSKVVQPLKAAPQELDSTRMQAAPAKRNTASLTSNSSSGNTAIRRLQPQI